MTLLSTSVGELRPTIGPWYESSMTGQLYCGDCLEILETKIAAESVDLIYADPPFFSNRHYEVIWGDEGEVRSFEDRWEGGVEVYAAWMTERLRACHRVLKPTGSLYLHCDWHASHHLRLALDTVFGPDRFQNEIIWEYQTGGASKDRYARKHDNVFFYVKGKEWIFNSKDIKEKRTEKSLSRAKNPTGARYDVEDALKLPTDVFHIQALNPMAKERLGYPTQKPVELLERIVKASSDVGSLVLDPFCGCGTTLAAAQLLGRKWIGIDISPTAIKVIRQRLASKGAREDEMESLGLPTTVVELRALKPFEFQNWVVRDKFNGTLGKKGGDKGVDGLSFMLHEPIQVKQSDGIGRNVVDNFHAAIQRANKKKGWIVAFSFGKGAHEEAARVKREEGIEIVLVTVEELLSGPPTG